MLSMYRLRFESAVPFPIASAPSTAVCATHPYAMTRPRFCACFEITYNVEELTGSHALRFMGTVPRKRISERIDKMIVLNQRSKTPLYEQIYEQLRAGIIANVYPPASKLPSIRGLAEELSCSRNTVEAAYRLLMQEGFVDSKPGSGFVAEDLSLSGFSLPTVTEPTRRYATTSQTTCAEADKSENGRALTPVRYDFTYGNLQDGTFPATLWKSLVDDVLLSVEAQRANHYSDSSGELELRREIARRQAAARNVKCSPEQVIVQSGTQASLQNLLLLFDPAHDTVAMEEPGYDGARSVFERNRFKLHPLPVLGGQRSTYLQAAWESKARLAYTTPSNQFPIGLIMPPDLRLDMIAWAHETDAYIIEDDYCFEFSYSGRPVPSLQSLDEHGRVVYQGTFSKSLSPALRMNFLILPPDLLERWNETFANAYPSVPWLSQVVLQRYLSSHQGERRLRRLQVLNRRKHDLLLGALQETMGSKIEVLQSNTGLHMLVNVLDGRSQGELIARGREAGVRVYGIDHYWMAEEHPLTSCVLIGFSAIEEEDVVPGVQALARAWFS